MTVIASNVVSQRIQNKFFFFFSLLEDLYLISMLLARGDAVEENTSTCRRYQLPPTGTPVHVIERQK